MMEDLNKIEKNREETEQGRLVNRIRSRGKTDEEWFQLRNDIKAYIASDPPAEALKELMQYTEMVEMACITIEYEREIGHKK